jgi:translation initiation factor 4A
MSNLKIKSDENQEKINKTDEIIVYENFDDMGISDELLRGIYSYGFEKPSAIQQKAIVKVAEGHDVIAQAQSGSGKTAAFLIGSLKNINYDQNVTQKIVLTPTRDLAKQIYDVLKCLANYTDLTIHTLIGGTKINDDIYILNRGIHYIIGTPGRIYDMIKRKNLNVRNLKSLILDEADEMLSRGFSSQIYDIFQEIPTNVQVCLFSATMPEECIEITNKFMRNPIKILVKKEYVTLEGIKQYYIDVQQDNYKYEILCDLYKTISVSQAIIFCRTKQRVDQLHNELNANNFACTSISSELSTQERESILKDFKHGNSRILIATDLIARGIDIQQVSLVINYDLPRDKENYIHRIGRAGRFGRKGVCINLITRDDVTFVRDLEKFYGIQIEELPANIEELI